MARHDGPQSMSRDAGSQATRGMPNLSYRTEARRFECEQRWNAFWIGESKEAVSDAGESVHDPRRRHVRRRPAPRAVSRNVVEHLYGHFVDARVEPANSGSCL